MIGELINKFDALPENEANLGTFNKMFRASLDGDLNASIEILGLTLGNFREVAINGNIELVELNHYPVEATKEVAIEFKYKTQVFLHGELLGEFRLIKDITRKYRINSSTIRKGIESGKTNKLGYSFKHVVNELY